MSKIVGGQSLEWGEELSALNAVECNCAIALTKLGRLMTDRDNVVFLPAVILWYIQAIIRIFLRGAGRLRLCICGAVAGHLQQDK